MASITKRGDYQWQAIIRCGGWDSQTESTTPATRFT
jgi:hypothetical protein